MRIVVTASLVVAIVCGIAAGTNRAAFEAILLSLEISGIPLEEFLAPLELTRVAFAADLGIPLQRVDEIVRGKRGITAATAWLFAGAFGATPQFWTNLQSQYDLAHDRPTRTFRRLRRTG